MRQNSVVKHICTLYYMVRFFEPYVLLFSLLWPESGLPYLRYSRAANMRIPKAVNG